MIELINIKISYNKKIIIENFNLKISNGEKIILTGISGSGKSSILKAILGFVIPESGDILVNKEKITGKTINRLRENFAYVSQGIEFRNEKVSVLIDEIFNFKNNKKSRKNLENINSLFEFVNLNSDILEKNIEELSGGEKQRVGIVISLLLDKEVYILDEITSALDIEMKKKIVNYFLDSKKTVIAVSHDSEWTLSEKTKEVKI